MAAQLVVATVVVLAERWVDKMVEMMAAARVEMMVA